jgi:hypothetical protein
MTDDSNTLAARLAAAADFIARGWPVLVLHDVTAGVCSCGNPKRDPKHDTVLGSAGKHPIHAAWGASAMTDVAQVAAALAEHPGANLGILTGQQAGIWVLDIDPRHGGDARLAELEARHGPLPYTYTVRTGSGGTHYYFALPDDFTPTTSRGQLPSGIDVRGQGGQVVAPPSVTLVGRYWVAMDAPVAAAPAWLLELIRSRPPREPQPPRDWSPQDVPAGDRLHRYALSAAMSECARLGMATPGTRGSTAFEVACNLIELCNSPWSGLDAAAMLENYGVAAWKAMEHGGAFNDAEAMSAWASAQRRVGDRGRDVPAELSGGASVLLPEGVPPFPEGEITSSPSSAPLTPLPSGGSPVAIPPATSTSPGGTPMLTTPGGLGGAPTTFPGGASETAEFDPVEALLGELVTGDQLAALPPPEPLVEGFLVTDSVAWVIGPPGHGKSFVVNDIAMSVGTGTPWQGYEVRHGLFVYLVAEGARGMGVRHKAWEAHHGAKAGQNVLYLPRPVQASGPEWDTLVRALARLRPVGIALDTQARVTVGMEENSNTEMGQFVEQVERLRRATGACVIVVHHTTKGALVGRGAGALQGAAQSELTVTMDKREGSIAVKTTKQKDGVELPPVKLRFVAVEVEMEPPVTTGMLSTPGRTESSVVLTAFESDASARQAVFDEELSGAQLDLAQIMAEVFAAGVGGTKAEVRKQYGSRSPAKSTAATDRAFLRAWNALLDRGALARVRGTASYRWVPIDERTEPEDE